MNVTVFITLVALAFSLKLSNHLISSPGDIIVGGYQSLDVNNLPSDAQEVDVYLRGLHTNFQGAKLVSAKRQVVAGFNYRYIYE
jgi:hypothetical protein